jgi:hypothetical protein
MIVLDLITQVRNLALDAEFKGRKSLAAKLRAVADEEEAKEAQVRGDPDGLCRFSERADRPPA